MHEVAVGRQMECSFQNSTPSIVIRTVVAASEKTAGACVRSRRPGNMWLGGGKRRMVVIRRGTVLALSDPLS